MFGIGKDSVYIGYSLSEFSKVREILEQNRIEYFYDVVSRQEGLLGEGTMRGRFGSMGVNMDNDKMYEVKVNKKHYDKAKYLLKDLYK